PVKNPNEFIKAFLNDSTVQETIKVLNHNGNFAKLGLVKTFKAEKIKCSKISMDFFDRLEESGIVRNEGSISKCFDEYTDHFICSDELQKMLLIEESENFDLFSHEDRDEFLFRIFKHLVLGGPVCQYEDEINTYLDMTKLIYKDLVSVKKDIETGKLMISSEVFSISCVNDNAETLFPDEHPQNFFYLAVDSLRRHITVLYHAYVK
ncbi:hypothetical protein ROZALSC1DRAFT_26731, partial [Rozella allomycis CSF55]